MASFTQAGDTMEDFAFDYPASEGNQDDVYDITMKSVDKCTPAHGSNNLAELVPGTTWTDILYNAGQSCIYSFPQAFILR